MSAIRFASLFVALTLLAPEFAGAKPGFGEQVDAFCSAQSRGTPFADLEGGGFLSECALCHQFVYPPGTPAKKNVFDPPGRDYATGKSSGDFSGFCPAVTNRLPMITPIADRSANVGQMVVIDVSASDGDNDPLSLSVSNAPTGSFFVDHGNGSASFTWTPGASDIGSRSVTFLVHDDAMPPGQAMEVVVITVGSSNRPPQLGAIGPRPGDPGLPLEIDIIASDPDDDALTLSATPLPAGASFRDDGNGTGRFAWTPDTGQIGNHVVTFRVGDDGVPMADDSEDVTLTIGRVNGWPVLAPVGDRRTKVGQPLHVELRAQDPDGDLLVFEATGLPIGASSSDAGDGTAAIDWMPTPADEGTHPVTVVVSDDGVPPESDSESFALIVEAESPPSDVRIDDAYWEEKGRFKGRLRVRGSGAHPREVVGVLDTDTGLVLGSRKATGRGDFDLKVDPTLAPCAVQAQAGDVRSASVPVRATPASCGREPSLWVSARWECAEQEEDEFEEALLEVKGARAPLGAQVEVRESAGGAQLGAVQADERGRFRLRVPLAIAPASIEAIVTAGEHQWSSGPVPVRVDCDEDDDDDEEDDDDEKRPKQKHRSDDREDD